MTDEERDVKLAEDLKIFNSCVSVLKGLRHKLSLAKKALEGAKYVQHARYCAVRPTVFAGPQCDCWAQEHNRRIEEVLKEL